VSNEQEFGVRCEKEHRHIHIPSTSRSRMLFLICQMRLERDQPPTCLNGEVEAKYYLKVYLAFELVCYCKTVFLSVLR